MLSVRLLAKMHISYLLNVTKMRNIFHENSCASVTKRLIFNQLLTIRFVGHHCLPTPYTWLYLMVSLSAKYSQAKWKYVGTVGKRNVYGIMDGEMHQHFYLHFDHLTFWRWGCIVWGWAFHCLQLQFSIFQLLKVHHFLRLNSKMTIKCTNVQMYEWMVYHKCNRLNRKIDVTGEFRKLKNPNGKRFAHQANELFVFWFLETFFHMFLHEQFFSHVPSMTGI